VTFTIRTVPSAGARHAIGAFGYAAMNRLLGSTAKSSSRPAWRW
jgi:hypothetical protein